MAHHEDDSMKPNQHNMDHKVQNPLTLTAPKVNTITHICLFLFMYPHQRPNIPGVQPKDLCGLGGTQILEHTPCHACTGTFKLLLENVIGKITSSCMSITSWSYNMWGVRSRQDKRLTHLKRSQEDSSQSAARQSEQHTDGHVSHRNWPAGKPVKLRFQF